MTTFSDEWIISNLRHRVEAGPTSDDGFTHEEVGMFVVRHGARILDLAAMGMQVYKPPQPSLGGTVPLVLYFSNNADRQEMIEAVRQVKPGMVGFKTP